MIDEKPPRFAGNERATLVGLLQYQRSSFVKKVDGVDEAPASASPVASGTSLLWLANHLADAEITWVIRRFAGRPDGPDGDAPGATLADAVLRYQQVWREVDAVVAGTPSLDELCRAPDVEPVPDLRWVLAHLVEETARHAGHADILRELIDGEIGR